MSAPVIFATGDRVRINAREVYPQHCGKIGRVERRHVVLSDVYRVSVDDCLFLWVKDSEMDRVHEVAS